MNWLTDFVKPKLHSLVNRKDPPSDLWTKCGCGERMLYVSDLKENLHVCSYCDQHMYIDFESRFKQLFDDEKFELITFFPCSLLFCLLPIFTAGIPKYEHSLIATLEFPTKHLDLIKILK